jgi:thiol-disulfide isomerase/thioredoxin
VVLVDFWTYGCYNCVNTLPYVTRLYETYKDKGLVVVGVHTPEFPFERSAGNVQAALKRHGITYPGGAGQRVGDVERLAQSVLAGPIPSVAAARSNSKLGLTKLRCQRRFWSFKAATAKRL